MHCIKSPLARAPSQVFATILLRLIAAAAMMFLPVVTAVAASLPIDYDRDIRPILSNNCYKCHGPDGKERQAGLRFDMREVALKPAESGKTAIVPGKPEESELVARVFSTDDDERMPPPDSHKSLTDSQRQLLKQWIASGAKYDRHWSYVPPQRPEPPHTDAGALPRNPIDSFILARLKQEKLKPSAEADRITLIRRLSFDLTGLPPNAPEVEEFVGDSSRDAFERLIDKLLASPHFGERMALNWLDLVRYADSGGYHSDNERSVWPYRDYVIAAFNANKPFDRFTIEQIAGDLLPEANRETRIASGYNRLLQTTEEGARRPRNTRRNTPPTACEIFRPFGSARRWAAANVTIISSTPSRPAIFTASKRSSLTSRRTLSPGRTRHRCPTRRGPPRKSVLTIKLRRRGKRSTSKRRNSIECKSNGKRKPGKNRRIGSYFDPPARPRSPARR